MYIRKRLAMGALMVCLFLLGACAPAEDEGSVPEEFLFTLFTANQDDRYSAFEESYMAAVESAPAGEMGVQDAPAGAQEAADAYYAGFRPLCTEEALEELEREALPMTLDMCSLQSGVSVAPESASFTATGSGSDGQDEYFDYELTVNLARDGDEETFVVKGSIAVRDEDGTEKVSVFDVYNEVELFQKLK